MSSERDVLLYLEDILENMSLAREFAGEKPKVSDLREDKKTLYSLVQALQIVGEATKHVPEAIRSMEPGVPWREMAGMRDKLIHAYENIDLEIVVLTVRDRIPTIEPKIRSLIRRLESRQK